MKEINIGGACCGILDIDENNINYELLVVAYDIEKVKQEIRDIGYPLNWFMIKIFY